MSAKRPPTPTSGALVLDFQGPFEPKCELITGGCESFVALRLFANPDVAIYISNDEDADRLIRALQRAKMMRRAGS